MRPWFAFAILSILFVSAAARADNHYQQKPWQIHIGMVSPMGDVESDAGAESGFLLGFDYYLKPMGEKAHSFLGARYWRSEVDGGAAYVNWGTHYGIQWDLSQPSGRDSGKLYFKTALGLFTSAFKSEDDIFGRLGFGGWVSLGWEMGGPMMWGFEVGYYIMPEINNLSNNGWNFRVAFRP